MTFSYDPEMGTTRDQVRFLIDDTVESSKDLENEEITWALTQESNVYRCAALLADRLATRYAKKATSRSVGGLSISYSNRADEWRRVAATLREQAATAGGSIPVPVSTGMSKAEKEVRTQDEDLNLAEFRRGQMDNPGEGWEDDRLGG